MSTAPEDMACRQFHGTSPPLACLFFHVFHVLYDNVMTFDSDLKSVRFIAIKCLDGEANQMSRPDDESELDSASRSEPNANEV